MGSCGFDIVFFFNFLQRAKTSVLFWDTRSTWLYRKTDEATLRRHQGKNQANGGGGWQEGCTITVLFMSSLPVHKYNTIY